MNLKPVTLTKLNNGLLSSLDLLSPECTAFDLKLKYSGRWDTFIKFLHCYSIQGPRGRMMKRSGRVVDIVLSILKWMFAFIYSNQCVKKILKFVSETCGEPQHILHTISISTQPIIGSLQPALCLPAHFLANFQNKTLVTWNCPEVRIKMSKEKSTYFWMIWKRNAWNHEIYTLVVSKKFNALTK